MFVRKIFCCFFLGLTGLLFSQDLLWPTDASHLITSTFCEYRPGHFHAGIDIKTWSKTGYKIFAVGDGSVIRIKTSPYNYGRVLFLKLKNNMRIVYGHLSNFSPDIETLVRDEQKRLSRYSLDIHIPEGQFLVKKGDILGYTGRSGTKTPHLHFEIRDENNQPFNPFIAGFTITDTISPTITSLAVTPLTSGSRVNGDFIPITFPIFSQKSDYYRLADTVFCKGYIGFSLAAYDRADGADNEFSPYRLSFFLDDNIIFSTKYDSFSFSQTRQICLDRNYRLMKMEKGYFHNLYRQEGNTLNIYYSKGNKAGIIGCSEEQLSGNKKIMVNDDGSVLLAPGIHKIKIMVSDFYNNISLVSGILYNSDFTGSTSDYCWSRSFLSDGNSCDSSGVRFYWEIIRNYLYCSLYTESTVIKNPTISVEMEPWKNISFSLLKQNNNTYKGQLPLPDDYTGILIINTDIGQNSGKKISYRDTIMVHSIKKNRSYILNSRDMECSIYFPDSSLYQSLKGYCKKSRLNHPDCILGYQYSLFPQTVPLKNPINIRFNSSLLNKHNSRVAIYTVKKEGFSFLGNTWNTDFISAWSGQLGSFTLLQDTVAPDIYFVSPDHEETIINNNPKIVVGLRDTLSGIGGENCYIIRVDSIKIIVEYDPQEELCYGLLGEPLKNGIHSLEIIIKDRVNNVNKWEGWFKVNDSDQ